MAARRHRTRRPLGLSLLALTATVGLTGCPETDRDRNLYISNDTEAVVRMATVNEAGEVKGSLLIPPGGSYIMSPPAENECTTVPIVALQDGTEIERFDPPICYGSGRTLTVDEP